MPGKFLNLTFHGPNALTGEDLLFKKTSAPFVTDAMDEPDAAAFFNANFNALRQPPGKLDYSGLDVVTGIGTHVVTLNHIGPNAWQRPAYKKVAGAQTIFEQWLTKVFATPVDALVLAGHHSFSLVWGAADPNLRGRHFCALDPKSELNDPNVFLKIVGRAATPVGEDPDLDLAGGARGFDVTNTLRRCKLLVLFGCNGATDHAVGLREWIRRASGRAPYILSWQGVHTFPRDKEGVFVSEELWSALDAIAPGTPGNKTLDFLHDPAMTETIAKAWFGAVKKAFRGTKRQHLLFERINKTKTRGAGAIDPNGRVFRTGDLDGTLVEGVRLS